MHQEASWDIGGHFNGVNSWGLYYNLPEPGTGLLASASLASLHVQIHLPPLSQEEGNHCVPGTGSDLKQAQCSEPLLTYHRSRPGQ